MLCSRGVLLALVVLGRPGGGAAQRGCVGWLPLFVQFGRITLNRPNYTLLLNFLVQLYMRF
jgi:hypothetical protein